jgi:hypothetical protein
MFVSDLPSTQLRHLEDSLDIRLGVIEGDAYELARYCVFTFLVIDEDIFAGCSCIVRKISEKYTFMAVQTNYSPSSSDPPPHMSHPRSQ